jgi:antitoxin component of MazEF toxin-antitoxin module
MKIMIEEWDGDGAIRIPDEALQELELDVGDAVYLIEEFVGNTRCLVLSKTPQIANRKHGTYCQAVLHAMRGMVHRHKLSQLKPVSFLKSSSFVGTCRHQCHARKATMHERFRVIETTTLDDGSKRYRVVDLVEGGSASKHGIFKARPEAEAVCSTLNAEHPMQLERASHSTI